MNYITYFVSVFKKVFFTLQASSIVHDYKNTRRKDSCKCAIEPCNRHHAYTPSINLSGGVFDIGIE